LSVFKAYTCLDISYLIPRLLGKIDTKYADEKSLRYDVLKTKKTDEYKSLADMISNFPFLKIEATENIFIETLSWLEKIRRKHMS
jgi:hypothetical protein